MTLTTLAVYFQLRAKSLFKFNSHISYIPSDGNKALKRERYKGIEPRVLHDFTKNEWEKRPNNVSKQGNQCRTGRSTHSSFAADFYL